MSAASNSSRDRNTLRNRTRRAPYRLQLESLESRMLLATFFVNSIGDETDATPGNGICETVASGGVCTLRAAIEETNALANNPAGTPDEIRFSISGVGVHTISPGTALPTITQPVIIDGYTQDSATADPADDAKPNTLAVGNDAVLLIELNGIAAASSALTITAGNSTVRGLVINRFSRGVVLQNGGGNTIAGNFIGTNAAGTTATGFNNVTIGILFDNSPGNTIGGTDPAARNVILGGAGNRAINALDTAGGQTIQGNYIGSNAAGTAPLGSSGIQLFGGNNLIGGTATGARNVIATTGAHAIALEFFAVGLGGNNIVQGNYIGVTADGNAMLGNGPIGIFMATDGNLIGGTTPEARNVIVTASNGTGVQITSSGGPGASNNTVQGNYIGLNAAGTTRLPGLLTGIGVHMAEGANNLIGGTVPGAGNVIAGFAVGIQISAGFSIVTGSNFVQGNFIGTNPVGTAALANIDGIRFAGVPSPSNNTVGGTAPGAGNVISGNTQSGVILTVAEVSNTIQGNFIGLAADGTTPLGNGLHGINILQSDGNTAIGGLAVGAGNRIAFNGGDGVFINTGSGTSILGNSIHSNVELGIDLNPNGVSANDNLDPDTGPNNLQNFPALMSAKVDTMANTTTVQYKFNSTASTTGYRLEFFSSSAADPSGFGEGQVFRGSQSVDTGASGNSTTTSFTFSPALPLGQFMTATATDPANNTSEFSNIVCAAATDFIQVTNTLDSGPGSLRQAILDSNASVGVLNTISFCIPGAGVHTISPISALDTITDPLIIDGTTQSGASCNTNGPGLGSNAVLLIELNGSGVGAGANGLNITAGGSTVRGLVINRFNGSGIRLATGGGNLVECNYVGTDVTGTLDFGNGDDGVQIDNAPNNTIGGGTAGARNLISGNNDDGVSIFGSGSTGNQVQGNFIGTNANGTAALGNADNGVRLGVGSASNTIGGMASGAGNVISGNGDDGVRISDGATRNVVQGNAIGTNAFGSAPVPNLSQGVSIQASPANTIGGTAFGASNVISGNNAEGARIEGAESQGNLVHGNLIGTNFAGAMLGNGSHGVLAIGSGPNEIGGTVAGAGNTIAFNGGDGVAVVFVAPSSFFKFIRQNSIFMNAGLGIDLEDDGVTVNDPGDTDTGANDHYNFPILELATVSGGNLTLTGFARPGAAIELFIADPDPTGFGEGKTFLTTLTEGSAADTDNTTDTYGPGLVNGLDQGTDTTNRFSFTIPTPAGVAAGTALTATGTDLNTNTSEFSGNVTVAGPAVCGLTVTTTADVVNAGDMVNSLREAIICANATPGADVITVPAGTYTLTITGTGEDAAATGDLDITDDVTFNGATGDPSDIIIQAGTLGPGDTGGPNGIDRVFDILDQPGPVLTDVDISGVTIRHGRGSQGGGINMNGNGTLDIVNSIISNNAPTGQGGGLNNNVNGAVTITDSVVSGNVTTGQGGGINNNSNGTLTVTTSQIINNQSGSRGGGINNNSGGTLLVTDSTISGNSAVGITAGGIHNNSSGSTTIIRSTISGNSAAGGNSAGGVHNNSSGSLTLINSTVSGNSANGDRSAGGLNNNSSGTVTVTNVTIAKNSVVGSSNISGNIYINSSGPVRLQNTIVADSTGGPNCVGNPDLPASQGNNLDDDGSCMLAGAGDISNVDPLLGMLANNGGPTETHLPAPGSPVVDVGDDAVLGPPLSLTTDQRGPGFPRKVGAALDIGAVEVQQQPPCSLIVNTTADIVNATDTFNSLREAIICANATLGANTIMVPAGTYTLTIAGADEDAAAQGDLDITDALTINGAGAATTIVQAGTTTTNGIDRVLDIVGDGFSVTISGLTIRNGNRPRTLGFDSGTGGGISIHGTRAVTVPASTVTITNSVISSNSAGEAGGGISNVRLNTDMMLTGTTVTGNHAAANDAGGILHVPAAGNVTLTDSTISDNTAGRDTGGIFVGGGTNDLFITNSTISGNSAGRLIGGIEFDPSTGNLTVTRSTIRDNSAATRDVGGILFGVGTGDLLITDSTISGNTSADNGGGLELNTDNGTMTITNSTISGNRTGTSGGGIHVSGNGALNLTNVTITGNTADNDGNGTGDGGGIAAFSTVNLRNTILAGNTDKGGQAPDGSGPLTSQGHNLIQSTAGLTLTGDTTGNILGQDAKLGPLADNGGPTQTRALLAGSPAIDAGDDGVLNPPLSLTTDQRGAGFPRLLGAHVDIGAFEATPAAGCSLVVNTTLDVVSTGDAVNSLREAVICANATPGPDTITVPAGTYTLAITGTDEDAAATGDLDITDGLTINGAGAATTIIQAGTTPGAGIDRVFDIIPTNIGVAISGVTIQNGTVASPGGAGIRSVGALTVTNSTITANHVTGPTLGSPDGGGILITTPNRSTTQIGTLTLSNSTITNNRAAGAGGGIDFRGAFGFVPGSPALTAMITDSTISNNQSEDGGAIGNFDPSTSLVLTRVTLNDNTSGSGGGAIDNSPANGDLTLTDCTIMGNTADVGGGIIHTPGTGNVVLTNCTLDNNTSTDGGGGGIFHSPDTGNLTVTNSRITGNTAGGTSSEGGGIAFEPAIGSLTVTDSTIANNKSVIQGGGIFFGNTDGNLDIIRSTISGNRNTHTSNGEGGGIFLGPDTGTLAITNSTISTNTAAARGGGIYHAELTLAILNSTIAGNGAPDGGGIFTEPGATTNLKNTIVVNSTSGGNFGGTLASFSSQGNNLSSDNSGATFLTAAGDLNNTDPLLGPLADNGGPTLTHALCTGAGVPDASCTGASPAIDAGDDSVVDAPLSLTTDQRGTGFPRRIGAHVDIGAVEAQPPSGCSLAVTTELDTVDAGDMVNSLREAIICANNTPGPDTITVPAGTYTLTITGQNEEAAATGDLDITDDLTINGAGAATTIIQACAIVSPATACTGIDRVFHAFDPAGGPATDVNISGVTIRHGTTSENGGGIFYVSLGTLTVTNSTIANNTSGFQGGGIQSDSAGTVNITDSTLTGNVADDEGGAIQINAGTLNITRSAFTANQSNREGGAIESESDDPIVIIESTFSGNTAPEDGGAIENDAGGDLVITRSTFTGNSAGELGGAIKNDSSGTTTVTESTISGNSADFGGGIQNDEDGIVNVIRSTISGNTAMSEGGGIWNVDGTINVTNSTISGNSASPTGGGEGGGVYQGTGGGTARINLVNVTVFANSAAAGGGIFNDGSGIVTLTNTIVAASTGGNCGGTGIGSSGHNLDSDGTCGLAATGDQSNTNPQLGPLTSNGGPTETHLPAPGSPTFDAGDDAVLGSPLFLTTDQRGPGFPRQANAHVDIGAVEGQPGAATFDFGDAPSSYGNPSHQLTAGPILGDDIDSEATGQPNSTATGDDNAATDDETGVTFVGPILVGRTANVNVEVNFVGPRGTGKGDSALLDAFLDFNGDGDFADPGEQIFDGQIVFEGTNSLSFPVPADAVTGFTFARFRVSSSGGLSFDGPASDGEVEDYRVTIIGGEGGCEDFALDVPETGEGNVKARVSGGVLKIRGDVLGNGLVIEAGDGPGSYQISPLGATTINRQFGTVQFVGVTRGIQIGLLGGPDVLVLDGTSAELAVTGKLRIRSGTGSTAIIDRALSLFDDNDIVAIVDVLLESGLSVRLRRGADDLSLCGVEALDRVRTGEGLGPDTLMVDDSTFNDRYNSGIGVGQDVMSIEQHGNVDGPTTEFDSRTKLRTRRGNDAICIGNPGEPGNSANFHGRTKIRGGRGRHDSLDAGLGGEGGNTFDTPPSVGGIEQLDAGNPACGLE